MYSTSREMFRTHKCCCSLETFTLSLLASIRCGGFAYYYWTSSVMTTRGSKYRYIFAINIEMFGNTKWLLIRYWKNSILHFRSLTSTLKACEWRLPTSNHFFQINIFITLKKIYYDHHKSRVWKFTEHAGPLNQEVSQ